MTISFIIPVYNTAKYLDRCLDSILGQNLNEDTFEVIAINDGSTDNSEQILSPWRQKMKHIKIIHTPNEGLGSARNTGIRLSKGKYIFFLDSDDYVLENSLHPLFAYAEQSDIDLIGFNWQTISPDGKTYHQRGNKIPYDQIVSGAEYMSQNNLKAGVCFYLYRTHFLRETSLLMPEGIYHEDELFLPKAFVYAQQVSFVDQTIYAYCQHAESITHRTDEDFLLKRIDDLFIVLDELIVFSGGVSLTPLQREAIMRKVHFLAIDIIVNLLRFGLRKDIAEQVLLKLSQRNLYPLPKMAYGMRYKSFRTMFNSPNRVYWALKVGLFAKKGL